MITAEQMAHLHRAISGGAEPHFEEILDQMIYVLFETADLNDMYQAHEEIVDAAGRGRDEADRAIETQQQDAEDVRGCDLCHERKETRI